MSRPEFQDELHILGNTIPAGSSTTINFNIANLYTSTKVEIPIIVERSLNKGPTLLITAGIHGDEINGVEVVRQLIAKKINKPACGTIICIPILNVFGFLTMNRYFPDGKDLNRVFPGTAKGSLASRFAYHFVRDILPHADLCLDFHAGGASRFNAPQIRVASGNERQMKLAAIFNAPFTLISKNLKKSYRSICSKKDIAMLLFEGGKSQSTDQNVAREGVEGVMRVLASYGMLAASFEVPERDSSTVWIANSSWIRAKYSGLLHVKIPCGKEVAKGELIAVITDPYGKMRHQIKAPRNGHIININESPLVYQGDAIFHIALEKP